MLRTYTELLMFPTFRERFRYLKLKGAVGEDTFGYDRYLNQGFYHSDEWRSIRDRVILRDEGCDLGIPGREIGGRVIIHHMNPISVSDIVHATDILIDPEYLICCSHDTHNAIHYSDESLLMPENVERFPFDTCPWKL